MKTIGERIRDRRKELKMTQDELAQLLGYKSRTSVNKIEKNVLKLQIDKVTKIAQALKTTPDYILGREEKPKEKQPLKFTVSNEARENLYKLIDSLSERLALTDTKIYEAVLEVMAELDEKQQGQLLGYAEALKDSSSYREHVEKILKQKKR